MLSKCKPVLFLVNHDELYKKEYSIWAYYNVATSGCLKNFKYDQNIYFCCHEYCNVETIKFNRNKRIQFGKVKLWTYRSHHVGCIDRRMTRWLLWMLILSCFRHVGRRSEITTLNSTAFTFEFSLPSCSFFTRSFPQNLNCCNQLHSKLAFEMKIFNFGEGRF